MARIVQVVTRYRVGKMNGLEAGAFLAMSEHPFRRRLARYRLDGTLESEEKEAKSAA